MADIDQQPRQDLSGDDARSKIHELGKDVRTCMFGSQTEEAGVDFRPMAIQAVEEDGSVWFLSSSNSDKNAHLARDDRVVLTFQDDGASKYMYLSGRADIHADKATIDKYWTAFANNWFDGQDDPRVTVIRFRPMAGHYWETDSGKIVAMAKMMIGAVTGGAIKNDGGVDGELSV